MFYLGAGVRAAPLLWIEWRWTHLMIIVEAGYIYFFRHKVVFVSWSDFAESLFSFKRSIGWCLLNRRIRPEVT